MKYLSLLGVSLAAALLFALPASAAISAIYDPVAPMVAPFDDCRLSLASDNAILFAEASDALCAATTAELTGLCLTPASEPMPGRVVAAFVPDLDISCTLSRPSPPG